MIVATLTKFRSLQSIALALTNVWLIWLIWGDQLRYFTSSKKVSSKLSDLKPLHPSWIVDLYKHMQGEDELILKGFKEAGIWKAISDLQEILEIVENPFRA